jgi:hypothetical protein
MGKEKSRFKKGCSSFENKILIQVVQILKSEVQSTYYVVGSTSEGP